MTERIARMEGANGVLHLRADNPAWQLIADALNAALEERAMATKAPAPTNFYAFAYPLYDHPNQSPGQNSIHNSYLFAVVEQMEYLEALLYPVQDVVAEPDLRDADDFRAIAMLTVEHAPLFDMWYAF